MTRLQSLLQDPCYVFICQLQFVTFFINFLWQKKIDIIIITRQKGKLKSQNKTEHYNF